MPSSKKAGHFLLGGRTMPVANIRPIKQVLSLAVLAYGVLKNDSTRARPIELTENGNIPVELRSSSDAAIDTLIMTGIGDGRKTVAAAGTAERLAGLTTCKKVVITAELDNAGTVVVGGSTVVAALATRRGTPLTPGDSVAIETNNLNNIWLDATSNGDGVTYHYVY